MNFHRFPGLGEAPVQAQPQFADEPGFYVYQRTLTANQVLSDLTQSIDNDSDFILTGLLGSQTGAYTLRFKDANLRYVSSAAMRNSNIVGSAPFPVPLFPNLVYPAGSRISIDLTDLTGSSNTIELVFVGIKRFRTR